MYQFHEGVLKDDCEKRVRTTDLLHFRNESKVGHLKRDQKMV